MKTNLISQFKLPTYIKGKSFAQASKAIEDKFKERTDKVSNETKQELLERLSQAQEYLKQSQIKPSNEPNQNQAMFGADLGEVGTEGAGKDVGAEAYLSAGTSLFSAGQQIFGDTNMDTSGRTEAPDMKEFNKGKLTKGVGGALNLGKGIATGNPADIIKGGAEILGSVFGKGKKDILKAEGNFDLKQANQYKPNDYANGGYTNKYDGITNPTGFVGKRKPVEFDDGNNGVQRAEDLFNFAKNGINNLENPDTILKPKTRFGNFLDKAGEKAGEVINNHGAEALRYAPILGNLFNKIETPDTARGSRLDSTYRPQLFDEKRLINELNQNNINKGLTEASGGDQGALRTNLLAAHLNKNKAKSDAYFKGSEVNRAENKFKFQTDRDKDKTNISLDTDYNNRKAQDEGAYNTAKQAKRSALFEDIGQIGKEQSYKKMVKEMFGYRWNGKYFVDKKGNRVEQSTIDAKTKSKK